METTPKKPIKVMLVDDHLEVLKTLKKILETRGYEVQDFNNPVQALEALQKNQPDIILSDLMMPQMNGIEFLSQVKKIFPNIPFIIMTAFATLDTASQATQNGAFDYIVKPFEISKIYDALEKAVMANSLIHSP